MNLFWTVCAFESMMVSMFIIGLIDIQKFIQMQYQVWIRSVSMSFFGAALNETSRKSRDRQLLCRISI